jgi:hypothetical protein
MKIKENFVNLMSSGNAEEISQVLLISARNIKTSNIKSMACGNLGPYRQGGNWNLSGLP